MDFCSRFYYFCYTGLLSFFSLAPATSKALYLDTWNEVLTLIFAIFVGYFAFLQVIESRFDKLREKAEQYQKTNDYDRAIKYYEDCIKINSGDFNIWSNLMEFYLINKRFEAFNDKLDLFTGEIRSSNDKVIYHYLIITREILQQHNGEAKTALNNLITFMKENPGSTRSFSWSFNEVIQSDLYTSLGSEAKKLYGNMRRYLQKQLSPEEKIRFESGDYELNPVQPPTPAR